MEAAIATGPRPAGWVHTAWVWTLGALAAFAFALLFVYSPAAGIAAWAAALIGWYAARRLEWAALALFFVIPLGRLTWLDPTGNLDIAKLIVAALGIGWGFRCLTKRDASLLSVWVESPISVLFLFFMLANAMSLLDVHAIARSVFSLARFTALLVMFGLMVALVRTKRDVKIVIVLLLLSGLLACLIGVWEGTTHQYLWNKLGQEHDPAMTMASEPGAGGLTAVSTSEDYSTMRVMGVFTGYNYMGGYMAVLLGIAGGCFLAWRLWYLRLALLGFVGLVLYCTVLTGSRGGLMGVAVTAVALLLLSRIRIRWFILVGIVIACLLFMPVVNQFAPQFRHGISIEDLKQDQRYGYWQMALHMIADYPILGVGTDNFYALYPFYRVSPALMYKFYCHNIYLQMWAEAGLPGLIVILALVTTIGLHYGRALRLAKDEQWRSIILGFFAAFLGYAVFAGTCNCLHDQPLWWLAAMAVILLRATRVAAPPSAAASTG